MPLDESIRAQIETYVTHLNGLIRRGREARETLAKDPSDPAAIAATRAWQEDCGVTINQLSGGSKSHWLARSFSGAFLMRSADGRAAQGAPPAEIVNRMIDVLQQAIATLSGMEVGTDASEFSPSAWAQAPAPRRFEFVHNSDIRPVLEQAYTDSRQALEQAHYDLALRTSCGILEAIVTDALEFEGPAALAAKGAPAGRIADWSFQTRLAVAEKVGLIRSGCARLPAVARTYRDQAEASGESSPNAGVSERDARVTGQVLHVVMRDLYPTR
jgi:hypothetical protein